MWCELGEAEQQRAALGCCGTVTGHRWTSEPQRPCGASQSAHRLVSSFSLLAKGCWVQGSPCGVSVGTNSSVPDVWCYTPCTQLCKGLQSLFMSVYSILLGGAFVQYLRQSLYNPQKLVTPCGGG